MSDPNKYIAIGDIHGCAESLRELLKKLEEQYGTNRIYVFLGDYTDRGPSSKDVVDQLIEFKRDHECVFILGNHDQMLLDAYCENEWRMWMHNGAQTTLTSYNTSPADFELPEGHYDFFTNTRLWWETEEYLFVHGGISPQKTVKENLEDESEHGEFIWQRAHIHAPSTKWEKTVVFGHTPVKKPIVRDSMLGIDTGCVYKSHGYGILTAVALPEIDFIEQECLDF